MDEKVEESTSETETVEAGVRATPKSGESGSPADEAAAATPEKTGQMPGSPIPAAVRSLDLNELQEFSGKQLKALARDLDLFLQPTRSRHQHILDIVRVALTGGATVTAEGFLDQVSDSFAMLRWPKFNFLPLPEDVAIPRALSEQCQLRPGQRSPGEFDYQRSVRNSFRSTLSQVSKANPARSGRSRPTDKLTPQFPQGRLFGEPRRTPSARGRLTC
jgi:transcription termination factor Rho